MHSFMFSVFDFFSIKKNAKTDLIAANFINYDVVLKMFYFHIIGVLINTAI